MWIAHTHITPVKLCGDWHGARWCIRHVSELDAWQGGDCTTCHRGARFLMRPKIDELWTCSPPRVPTLSQICVKLFGPDQENSWPVFSWGIFNVYIWSHVYMMGDKTWIPLDHIWLKMSMVVNLEQWMHLVRQYTRMESANYSVARGQGGHTGVLFMHSLNCMIQVVSIFTATACQMSIFFHRQRRYSVLN